MGKTFVVDGSYESDIPERLMEQLEGIKDQPYRNTAATVTTSNFNTLKEGNQTNLLYASDISLKEFELIKINNPDPKTRLSKYKTLLVTDILESNKDIPADLLWNNSTYGQKLLRVFITFDDHMTSAGLYSFLFHNSEFTFAMVDVLKEIKADRILEDYQEVVKEFGQKMDVFTANRKTYEYPLTSDKEKQAAFENAKSAVPSVDKIEQYYYDEDFQIAFYQYICTYVESNAHLFFPTNS